MGVSSGGILPGRPRLIIMLKEPRPGRVKTRLAADIGPIAAAGWYRRQSLSLIRRLSGDPRWQVVLAISPDHDGLASRVWPPGLPRMPQGPGDLGVRMARLLGPAPYPSLLIGSDIPGVTSGHIARAFRVLKGNEMVFGPAADGGFWLVGCKAGLPPPRFDNIRWSSEHTLADTLAGMPGRRIALADTLHDVDHAADLPVAQPFKRQRL